MKMVESVCKQVLEIFRRMRNHFCYPTVDSTGTEVVDSTQTVYNTESVNTETVADASAENNAEAGE